MKKIINLTLFVLFSGLFSNVFALEEKGTIVTTIKGDDWWLPEDVELTPYTGFGWATEGWLSQCH